MEFDHQKAVSLHAVESYLLDELSPALREQFEAHYFECPECAEALRAGLILQQNGRALLRAEPRLAVAVGITGNKAEEQSGPEVWWRAWLRIPSLLPMTATVFLVGLILFNPRGTEPTVVSVQPVRLAAQARSSVSANVIQSRTLQPIILDVKSDGSYLWTVRARKGGTAFRGTGDALHGELTLIVDTRKLDPGDYDIALRLAGDASSEEKLHQFTIP